MVNDLQESFLLQPDFATGGGAPEKEVTAGPFGRWGIRSMAGDALFKA